MNVLFGHAVIVFLLILRVSKSSVIHRRAYNSNSDSKHSYHYHDYGHNISINCGDFDRMDNTSVACQRDLTQVITFGYPWSPYGDKRNSRGDFNTTNEANNLRDALDSINHVCHIQERSQTCLDESGARDYCLAFTVTALTHQTDFQFICHQRRRDENLVRSLQCLHDSRVIVMLFFHIADRCRGFGILDDIMRRYKNAYFYSLDIRPHDQQAYAPVFYCIPKSVISTCIKAIVEDQCGTLTADFVQNYLVYVQDRHSQALRSAGISSNICDPSSDVVPTTAPIPSDSQLGISTLLELTTPGTALDTVYGKFLLAYLRSLSGAEQCNFRNVIFSYFGCLLSSDDQSEKTKFNIIQFAHQIMLFSYHGTRCNRLEQFTACWNLLQKTCGPKERGLELHATLLVEGCKIQSEMDIIGCHWQDMLLKRNIQASRLTPWPLNGQCIGNRLHLENAQYDPRTVTESLDRVLLLLQPAVKEISRKCGVQPAKRLATLLESVRYLQPDAFKCLLRLEKEPDDK